jgi:2-oxoglutarate dehydrogenase E1 component
VPKLARGLATPAKAVPPSPIDAFANGANSYYIEEMYRDWKNDPKSVHASWQAYFSGLDKGLPSAAAFTPPPGLQSGQTNLM